MPPHLPAPTTNPTDADRYRSGAMDGAGATNWDKLSQELAVLPDRAGIVTILERELRMAEEEGLPVGLVFVDLDAFRRINDTLGHGQGDNLLAITGQRIAAHVRPGDTVGRFGGDSFIVVAPGIDSVTTINKLVSSLLDAVGGSVVLKGLPLAISATAGVALSDGEATADTLFRRADTALHRAKREGHRMRFFDSSLGDEARRKLAIEARLRGALDRGDLWVAYQPIVDSITHRSHGVEALLRWKDDELGVLAPPAFIPIAESVGLMGPIGDFVFQQVISDWEALRRQLGNDQLTASVNLSPGQLQSASLISRINSMLATSSMPADRLVLEVVEDLVLSEASAAHRALVAARTAGMRVALDDFGTGKGSLAHLQAIECDELKIDQSFVAEMLDDHRAQTIVTASLHLASGFGVKVVAEGVETAAQAAFLAQHECELLQGYHFSRPVPLERLTSPGK